MTAAGDAIAIDVWTDVACPWCYIGKRNLERGVEAFRRDGDAPPVRIEYHSFELAPDTPVDFDGSNVDYLVQMKGISRGHAQALIDHVSAVAAEAGLDYRMDRVRHTRTVKAHEVIQFARRRGLQAEAVERLSRAYFVEGRHIGRDDDLASLGAEIGLDRDELLKSLRAGEFVGEVRADQALAAAYGIRGVPFFIVRGRYALQGAQTPEIWAAALARVARERLVAGPA